MDTFDGAHDLALHLRTLSDRSAARDSWALFCDPDIPALRCRMSAALTDAVALVEADRELIRIFDDAARFGLMVDRIVNDDRTVEYEVTVWGGEWLEGPDA